MDSVDPHLDILLQDFVRLYKDDASLGDDDGTALHEICRFVHNQAIQCPASTFRALLIQHGFSASKATSTTDQYQQFIDHLTASGQQEPPPPPLTPASSDLKEAMP